MLSRRHPQMSSITSAFLRLAAPRWFLGTSFSSLVSSSPCQMVNSSVVNHMSSTDGRLPSCTPTLFSTAAHHDGSTCAAFGVQRRCWS